MTKRKAITMCGDKQRVSYGQRWLKGQVFNARYFSFRAENNWSWHCVQLRTERQVWQGTWTVGVIATPLNNGSVKANASS